MFVRVPLDSAADVRREQRLHIGDPERSRREHRASTDPDGDVGDNCAVRRKPDDEVAGL